MGVSTSSAQDRLRHSTLSRRVIDVAGEPQSSKGPALQDIFLVHKRTTEQRHKALLSHSLKELTFHNTLKCVLRTKDMINKHLDGLEIFLDVFEAYSNSSNLQMTGGTHIYRPPRP